MTPFGGTVDHGIAYFGFIADLDWLPMVFEFEKFLYMLKMYSSNSSIGVP
jgi:hypothetical protein